MMMRRTHVYEDSRDEQEEDNAGSGWGVWPGDGLEGGSNEGACSACPLQCRKPHLVPPPIAPSREEDKIVVKPCGDG